MHMHLNFKVLHLIFLYFDKMQALVKTKISLNPLLTSHVHKSIGSILILDGRDVGI